MNGQLVEINGKAVQRITYRDVPVITLPMVDELHERPKKTAAKAFNRHKKRMIEGEDFFYVPQEEWNSLLRFHDMEPQTRKSRASVPEMNAENENSRGGYRGEMVFLTQTGYLMLVKVFDDDLSWQIQRLLVRQYFASKAMAVPQGALSPEVKFNFDLGRLVSQADRHLGGEASLRLVNYLIGMPVDDLIRKLEHKAAESKAGPDHEIQTVAAHLYAMLDETDHGPNIAREADELGRPYFKATTQNMLVAMQATGKKKHLPAIDFTPEKLGILIAARSAELENLGWRRKLERIVNGNRFFRYTCLDMKN